MKLPSEVVPGQSISAKQFNELLRYVRSLRLRGGPGTRVNVNSGGTTITAAGGGSNARRATLVHPFLITDASASGVANCTVRFGTVNDVTPTGIGTNLPLTSAAVWRVCLDATISVAGAVTAAVVTAATGAQPADSDTHAFITLGLVTVISTSGDLSVSDINQAATHSLRFCVVGRVVTSGAVTTRGTYNFWGF